MLLMLCALMTLYTITDAGFLTVCWQQARCYLSSLAVHNLKKEKEKEIHILRPEDCFPAELRAWKEGL